MCYLHNWGYTTLMLVRLEQAVDATRTRLQNPSIQAAGPLHGTLNRSDMGGKCGHRCHSTRGSSPFSTRGKPFQTIRLFDPCVSPESNIGFNGDALLLGGVTLT
jgi:hypothetical protein